MKVLYFAWVRERLGCDEEEVSLPHGVATVGDLLSWLEQRGEPYASVLADRTRLRVAVNQSFKSDPAASVGMNDEVAIFPPVTGGDGWSP